MGNNSSLQQDKVSPSPNDKIEQSHFSKKTILNSNRQKMREPDASLFKKTSINSAQNSKPEIQPISKSQTSLTENIKNDKNTINNEVPKNKLFNSQISIKLNQNFNLYDPQHFVDSLWSFLLQHSSNNPEISRNQFSLIIHENLEAIKHKFLTKIKKGEIYPIFSSSEENKIFEKDLQIFEITLKNQVHKYFSVSKRHPNHSGVEKYIKQVKEEIQNLGNTIICEFMGKTSIWRSLMLLKQEQQQKIIQMLEKEGIDQKHLREITQSKII